MSRDIKWDIYNAPKCIDCQYFNDWRQGYCMIWKQRVPEEHRERGCDKFDLYVPF